MKKIGVWAFALFLALCVLSGMPEGTPQVQTPPVMAQAPPVCGNGIVETGEQCDVANTPSGLDECDGCARDCTLTEECGPTLCENGLDEDSNGLTDSLDRDCTTLIELQYIATLGRGTPRSLQFHRESKVFTVDGIIPGSPEPYPYGDSKAEVCGPIVDIHHIARLEGSVTATNFARFYGPNSAGLSRYFVTTTGVFPSTGLALPWIGPPPGTCDVNGDPCMTIGDCPIYTPCSGRQPLSLSNTYVDLLGTGVGAPYLGRCNTAITALNDLASGVGSLGGSGSGNLIVPRRGSDTLMFGSGINLRQYNRIRLRRDATLTINGPANAVVVLQSDQLQLGPFAKVELSGGIQPRNVLFNVFGTRPRRIFLNQHAELNGSILAPARRRIRLGRDAVVNGSLASESVRLHSRAVIHHIPFTSLLPTDLRMSKSDSPDPVTAGSNLTYTVTVTNTGISNAPAVTVTDTLDSAVNFVSATSTQGTCVHDGSPTGGIIKCFLGTVARAADAPANQAVITVTVHIPCDLRGSISNTAVVNAQVPELNPSNNTVTEVTAIIEDAEISVTKTDSADPVEEGVDPLDYTITVTNSGTYSCARNVTLNDDVPDALVGESVSTSQGTCTGDPISCSFGNIAPGATVTVNITGGTVANGTALANNGAVKELTNTVTVSSPDDSTPGNNTATQKTDVTRNQGDSCLGGGNVDCATGFCVDGFCCDGGCTGTCEACSAALTGGTNGTCAPTIANTDPDNDCPTCEVCNGSGACIPASDGTDPVNDCATQPVSTCGQDGFCNGASACRLYASGTVCNAASCGGLTHYPDDTCDGSGTCVDGGSTNCDDGNVCTDDACNPGTGCSNTNNSAPCDDGLFCNGTDTCSGGSCSINSGDPCSSPGDHPGSNVCNDACDEGSDSCTANDPDNTVCDSGNGTCQSGVCQP